MELKDFVKNSIVEIVQGVSEAMKEIGEHTNAVVNPTDSHAYHSLPQNIAFDVAVTVQDENSVTGKAGGGIAVLQASINGESVSSNIAATRISFNIPVSLPSSPKKRFNTDPIKPSIGSIA